MNHTPQPQGRNVISTSEQETQRLINEGAQVIAGHGNRGRTVLHVSPALSRQIEQRNARVRPAQRLND